MISIKVPTLGESIVEATVSRWLKKEGEAVAVGDTLVELETDKITVEVTAMNAGVVKKIAHAEGDVVKVDELLAEIDDTASAHVERSGSGCRRSACSRAGSDTGGRTRRPHRQRPNRRNPPHLRRPRRWRFAHRPPRSVSRQNAVWTSPRYRARDAAVS